MSRQIKKRLSFILSLCFCLIFAISACGQTTDNTITLAQTENTQSTMNALEQSETSSTEESDNSVYAKIETTETTQVFREMGNNNEVLVAYFSHTEKTKGVAEYINNIVGGDILRLEPETPYPSGYSAALDPARREQRENARPKIKNAIENLDSYKVIYLGYPIWWGTTPMIINTFLEKYDFSNKIVVPFATSGGSGISKSINDIKSEIPNADVKDGLLVRNNDDIIPWLNGMGLYE